MRGWTWGLVTVMVAVVLIAIALIAVVTSSSSTALLDLEVGECFVLPTDVGDDAGGEFAVVESIEVLSCTEPHDAEVVAVGELNTDGDLDYPLDEELFATVDSRCAAVGDVALDRFGVVPVAPTERSWESFAGRFLCIAIPYGGGLVTEPAAGA